MGKKEAFFFRKFSKIFQNYIIDIHILSNVKLADSWNDSNLGFSFFNIHVIQNQNWDLNVK